MLKKVFFSMAMVLFVMSGCVGTAKVIVNSAPPKNSIKGATVQTKVDNNDTKQ